VLNRQIANHQNTFSTTSKFVLEVFIILYFIILNNCFFLWLWQISKFSLDLYRKMPIVC